MKKFIIFTIAILLLSMPVIPCSAGTTKPQYGGTMRILRSSGPRNIGYAAKQGFIDSSSIVYSERIFELAANGDLLPLLAESYETSADGKVITLHLRKGVKFHDGTDWNAEACVCTYETCKASGVLPDNKYIDSISAVDEYTVRITLNRRNSKMIYGLTRMWHYSPTAFKKHGEDWAISHTVSTAPFQVVDFKRDVIIKTKKFKDYWQPNRPYLDGFEVRVVKEPATCSAIMQAGQADIWWDVPPLQAAELRDKGYKTYTWPSYLNNIYCDSASPDSPFADKRVREAIEYAIDRPAVAKALGYGFGIPLNQLTPPGTQGYNPNYKGRPYNVEKAKKLLADAGHPSIKTKMMLRASTLNLATVIKNYLAEVGIEVSLDVADPGRFWGGINRGWKGLILGPSAINPEYMVAWLDHFGPEPIMKFASMAKSPKYLDLCHQVMEAPDIPTMRELTMDMVTQASEDAMAIPVTVNISVLVTQKNVHTSYYQDVDFTYWRIQNDWIEK